MGEAVVDAAAVAPLCATVVGKPKGTERIVGLWVRPSSWTHTATWST